MPKHIDSYSFGVMAIDGRTYTADLVLFPERVDDAWWRKQGHHCSLADLAAALVPVPKTLIIGTGEPGLMAVDDDLREYCRDNGIELTVLPTARAADAYNGCPDKESTVAAFHLTC
jgi:hypothetical protein